MYVFMKLIRRVSTERVKERKDALSFMHGKYLDLRSERFREEKSQLLLFIILFKQHGLKIQ